MKKMIIILLIVMCCFSMSLTYASISKYFERQNHIDMKVNLETASAIRNYISIEGGRNNFEYVKLVIDSSKKLRDEYNEDVEYLFSKFDELYEADEATEAELLELIELAEKNYQYYSEKY